MPLFSGNRQNHEFIEYTAVGHNVSYGVEDHQRETQPYEDSATIGRTPPQTSGQDASGANKSEGANHHIVETSQTPDSKEGLTADGWPQGPQQLRGVSMPLLVGDMLLILLPVAFLGTYVFFDQQQELETLIATSSGCICMATRW